MLKSTRQKDAAGPVSKHFVWLDWLRFGAAFMVLLVHARATSFVEYGALEANSKSKLAMIWFAFTRLGHEAVIVFFVLSGFLVGGKLIERVALQNFNWRSYGIDRATRILVPIVPAVIFAALIDAFYGHPNTSLNIVGTLFLLQDIGVPGVLGMRTISQLWSLAYEVWFYILAGALAVAVIRRPTPSRAALAIIFISFAIFTRLSTVYLFCWAIGALAYLYPRQKSSRAEVASSIAIILIGLVMYEISTASTSRSVQLSGAIALLGNKPVGELILSCGIALLVRNICTFVQSQGEMSFLGDLGTRLAAFSYTLYLIHFPVLTAINNMGYKNQTSISSQSLMLFVARIPICLVVSYLFYWLFERNTPAVRSYLRNRFLRNATT